MNNGYMGMVRQWQELFWDHRYSSVDIGTSPDWVKLAEAFGATGLRVEESADLEETMTQAIETDGPVLVDVRVTQEENVYPMIAPGSRRPRHGRGPRAGRGRKGRTPDGGWDARSGAPRGPAGPGQLSGRKHVLSIQVENKPGVLARVAGLFSRRGFNIDTLSVGPTDDPSVSRITLTLDGAVHPIDQVTKQLHKLVNVLKIRDMEPEETVAREMALFKVSAAVENRAEIIQFAEIFRAKIVDVARRTMTIEITGSADKIEAFERMVRPHGLVEMVRTGEIAIARGHD